MFKWTIVALKTKYTYTQFRGTYLSEILLASNGRKQTGFVRKAFFNNCDGCVFGSCAVSLNLIGLWQLAEEVMQSIHQHSIFKSWNLCQSHTVRENRASRKWFEVNYILATHFRLVQGCMLFGFQYHQYVLLYPALLKGKKRRKNSWLQALKNCAWCGLDVEQTCVFF